MTRETWGEIVSVIEAARGFQFTMPEQQVWFRLLSELPDDAAKQATVECLRTIEGRLVPAHIHNRAMQLSRDQERNRHALLDGNPEWQPVLAPSVHAELTRKGIGRIGRVS